MPNPTLPLALFPSSNPLPASKMSSSNTAILAAIASMEAQLAALKAQLSPDSAAPQKEEKKERKASEWLLFTARVRALLKENGYDGAALGKQNQMFCGALKEDAPMSSWTDADILARRAAWTVPELSKQAARGESWKGGKKTVSLPAPAPANAEAAPVEAEAAEASESDAPKEEKKKRGPPKGVKLSEEEKAKRKATREANKAKKEASTAPSESEEAPASDGEASAVSATSSEKKKRGPKKYADMTPEELEAAKAKRAEKKAKKEAAEAPASPALSAAEIPLPPSPKPQSLEGFQPIILKGKRYFVNLKTGHAYNRLEDESPGSWAGLFTRVGGPHIEYTPEPKETDVDELD